MFLPEGRATKILSKMPERRPFFTEPYQLLQRMGEDYQIVVEVRALAAEPSKEVVSGSALVLEILKATGQVVGILIFPMIMGSVVVVRLPLLLVVVMVVGHHAVREDDSVSRKKPEEYE